MSPTWLSECSFGVFAAEEDEPLPEPELPALPVAAPPPPPPPPPPLVVEATPLMLANRDLVRERGMVE